MSVKSKQPFRPRPVPDEMRDYIERRIAGNYFERDGYLSRLLELNHKGSNPLWICCEPGGGGTTFAKELAWSITKRPDGEIGDRLPDRTFLLRYHGSIRDTICDFHIPGYILLPHVRWTSPEEVLKEQLYQDKLQLLQAYLPKGSVLIMDGVEDPEGFERDPQWSDLMALGTVIVVCRDTETNPGWVIPPLPDAYRTGSDKKTRELDDGERIILQNAGILPVTGMNMLVFMRSQGSDKKETLLKLIREGLLGESVSVGILPANIPPGCDEDYKPFLEYLKKRADSPSLSARVYDQIANCFRNAAHILRDTDGTIALTAGKLLRNRGDLLGAIAMYELYLAKQEKLEPKDYVSLADALYEVGCANGFRGITCRDTRRQRFFELGKEMLHRALAYQEQYLSPGSLALARTRFALAQMSCEERNRENAEAMCARAIEEQLAALPADHHDLGVAYLEAAACCPGHFAQRKRRQEYAEKALRIFSACGPADCYLAQTYCVLQGCLPVYEYRERIRYERMALEIYEKCYPNHSWWLYTTHDFLAHLEEKAENAQGEIENLNAAMQILLEMLPPKHPLVLELSRKLDCAKNKKDSPSF